MLTKSELIARLAELPDLPIVAISQLGEFVNPREIVQTQIRLMKNGRYSIIVEDSIARQAMGYQPDKYNRCYENWKAGKNIDVLAIM